MKILHPENDNKYVPLKDLGNHLKNGYYSIIDKELLDDLPFYKNSKVMEKQIKILDNGFRNEYGLSVFYQPTKGYLNLNDFEWLKENNIKLKPYDRLKNCLLVLFPKKIKLFYGIFKK